MAERDPITQQYLALWELLDNHKELDALIRLGNRAKLHGDKQRPIKEQILTADLPELRLEPAVSRPHIQRTSSGSSLVCSWRIVVATGDQTITKTLFPVVWEVYRAMANWQRTLQVLTWKAQHFVKVLRAATIEYGMADPETDRGIAGWSSVWMCETESFFTTGSLLA